MDVDVVVARGRVDDRHPRVLLEERLQLLAAARDDEVDRVLHAATSSAQLLAVGPEQRHGPAGSAGLDQGAGQDLGDDAVGPRRRRAAAQDHGVAALQAQRRGVGRHVGPALVDHGDHAERHARAARLEPVRQRAAAVDLADRVGQRGHGAHAARPSRPPGPRRAAAGRSARARRARAWRPPRPAAFSRRISPERRSRASAISASAASRWRPGRPRQHAAGGLHVRADAARGAVTPRQPRAGSRRARTRPGGSPAAAASGSRRRTASDWRPGHRPHLVGRHRGDALAHAGAVGRRSPRPRRRPEAALQPTTPTASSEVPRSRSARAAPASTRDAARGSAWRSAARA